MKVIPKKAAHYYKNPDRYNTVIKSNKLIQQSRFSLTTQQQKIILFIISQIMPYDEDFKLYEFKVTEFCKLCGIAAQGDMYALLRAQLKSISDKSLWIKMDDGRDALLRWIEKAYIDDGKGIIQLKLDEDMKPYLLQLKEKFTEYDLIYTLAFKSKYSIRLYEYLKSIHYNKLKEYEQIFEIKEFEQILDSQYSVFKDFHTRVLKPAQKEINEHSDIIFNYELIQSGRKVSHIKIKIKTKEANERINIAANNERILDDRGRTSK